MGEHGVEGRAAARAAALQKRRLEPAAMLVGAFQIHDFVRAAVDLAVDVGEAGEMLGIAEHVGMRRAGIEPDVEYVVDLVIVGRIEIGREKARGGAGRIPGVGALGLEGVGDAFVDGVMHQRRMLALFDEHGDRHAPGALARHHPIGFAGHHALDAVLPGGGNPAGLGDGGHGRLA